MDLTVLNKDLDKTKSKVFMDKHNAAFLGSLMCSLNFKWDDTFPTSATDAVDLYWNPNFFNKIPLEGRKTVLSHELWHVGLLHGVRRGTRDPETWNIACDIKINLMLEKQGFSFEGTDVAPFDKKYIDWVEEDIYDDLIQNPPPQMPKCMCCAHTLPPTKNGVQQNINSVVQAMHQAKIAGQAGNLPGAIDATLKKFLEPVVPWEVKLMKFFTDMLDEDYSWARPNRRYGDMYLPSKFTDDGKLTHLMYFLDVSGSIGEKDSIRFNSEVKYVQEIIKPERMTLVQFDTQIQEIKELKEDEPFVEFKVSTGGGTCLVCVRDYIQEHKPTAAIIFSDMYVTPMRPLDIEIPIIWVCINNKTVRPSFGEIIHIN